MQTRSICELYLGGHDIYTFENSVWEHGYGLVKWYSCKRVFCNYQGFRQVEPTTEEEMRLVNYQESLPPSSSAMVFKMD